MFWIPGGRRFGSRGSMFWIHLVTRLGHIMSNCGSCSYRSEIRPLQKERENSDKYHIFIYFSKNVPLRCDEYIPEKYIVQ